MKLDDFKGAVAPIHITLQFNDAVDVITNLYHFIDLTYTAKSTVGTAKSLLGIFMTFYKLKGFFNDHSENAKCIK